MTERPELAVVFPAASVTGGVERVALELVRYESARRTTCFVGQHLDADGLWHEPVQLPRVPMPLRPLAFRRAAASVLSRLGPRTTVSFGVNCPPGDVYWVQSVHAAWLENGGDLIVRGVRVPAAARRMLLRHQVLLRLERDYFTNQSPRAVLCTSWREIEDLVRLYDVSRDILHVMPNGYDPSAFNVNRRAELRASMRASVDASDDDIVLLLVANEWHRKGLGTLLEAVAAVGDRRLRIDLVGRNAPDDYLRVAARLGLSDRLRWHGPSSDVARFHAAADVFVLPTTYEPFGIVIIEAMASGLPVITSRLAGAADAIKHRRNGTLLDDPRDAGALTAELAWLLDPAARERTGAAAAASVDDYQWTRVLARAESLILPR